MKDPTAFRQRVAAYRLGKLPYLAGRPITDDEYFDTMEKVAIENNAEWNRLRREEGLREMSVDEEVMRVLNDHTYDYRGYYNKYPQNSANAKTHWTDEFKTYLHPTFSDLSRYAPNNPNYVGKTQFNPYEIEGGHWINNETEFVPSKGMLDLKKRLLIPTYLNGKTPKTDAYDPYILNKVFHNMNVPTGQCAEWANRIMDNLGYNTYGDAWLQHGNVLFNGYGNVEFPQGFDEKIYDQYSTQAADNLLKNFNSDALLDKAMHYIVNMYYPESPNKKMAAKNGNGFYGTHTGVLFYDKDGKWKVAHNIGDGVSEKNKGAGKIWVEDFKQMLSKTSHHRPTAIITPNKHGSLSKARKAIRNIFGFADGKSPYDDVNMRITTLPEVEIVGKKPIRTVLNVESTNSFALPSLSDMIAPIPLLQYMLNFIRQYLHIPRLKAPYEFIEKLYIPKYDDGKEPGEEEYAIGTTMLPEVVITPTKDSPEELAIEQAYLDRFKNKRLEIPVDNTAAQERWFRLGILEQRDAVHNSPWIWGLRGLAAAPAAVMAPLANKAMQTVVANPYVNTALDSYFGASGIESIANGLADAMTALELMPLLRAVRPAYKVVSGLSKPVVDLANEGIKSTFAPFGNFISPKVGWYGRAAFDVITNPIGTYKAVKNGKYISDFTSLRRNYNTATADIKYGIQSTNNEYKNLVDIDIPDADVTIQSWKHFKPGMNGYYSMRENRIHMPLTRSRFSNIRGSSSALRNTGGHELAHAANEWLRNNFYTPELGVVKRRRILPSYYIPNPNHPIAKKYERLFKIFPSLTLNTHGMYPEETWANYMGAKAQGMGELQYNIDNFGREGIFPPKGFIEDYKQYLSDTYKPHAWFYQDIIE